MSILIKGMEMPTRCWDCPCSDKSNGVCEAIVGGATIWDDRPAWCPLIPVPPHGRLIDADALCDRLERAAKTKPYLYSAFDTAISFALVAPTIIPADKGGDVE